jgi:hypothetical protein
LVALRLDAADKPGCSTTKERGELKLLVRLFLLVLAVTTGASVLSEILRPILAEVMRPVLI